MAVQGAPEPPKQVWGQEPQKQQRTGRPREDGRSEPGREKPEVNIPPPNDRWYHHVCPHSPRPETSIPLASSCTPFRTDLPS